MIRTYLILAALVLSLLPWSSTHAEGVRAQDSIVGAWRLRSLQTVRPNGEGLTQWMGERPTGIIIYLPSGLMSVQMMRDPRPLIKSASLDVATVGEKASASDGYYAYFGAYEINAKTSTVTHHVQASLRPEEVGIKYNRVFQLDGDHLVLTTTLFDEEGEKRFNRLVWDRVK